MKTTTLTCTSILLLLLLLLATPHPQLHAADEGPITYKGLTFETVTERYKDGKVRRGVLQGEQQVTLGDTTYRLTGKVLFSQQGTIWTANLAKEVSVAINDTTYTFNKGRVTFHPNGAVRHGWLAEGQTFKVGGEQYQAPPVGQIHFYTNGGVQVLEFKSPQRLTIANNTFVFKNMSFYESGARKGGRLDSESPVQIGNESFKASRVEYHESGNLKEVHLKPPQPMQVGSQTLTIQSISFYENGNPKTVRPKEDNPDPFKSDDYTFFPTRIDFHEDGLLSQVFTDKPTEVEIHGHKLVTGNVSFHESGAVNYVSLKEPYAFKVGKQQIPFTARAVWFGESGEFLKVANYREAQKITLGNNDLLVKNMELDPSGNPTRLSLKRQEIKVGKHKPTGHIVMFDGNGTIDYVATSHRKADMPFVFGDQTIMVPPMTYLDFSPDAQLQSIASKYNATKILVGGLAFTGKEIVFRNNNYVYAIKLNQQQNITLGGKEYSLANQSHVFFHSNGMIQQATLSNRSSIQFNADGKPK